MRVLAAATASSRFFHVSGWGGRTPTEPDRMRRNWTLHSIKESYWIAYWLCGRLAGPGKLLFHISFVYSCLVWRDSNRTWARTDRRAMIDWFVMFSGICIIGIWVSLWWAERTNIIMWRIIIAVQVMAFLIAVQTFDGVGINFIATDIKVKVIQSK